MSRDPIGKPLIRSDDIASREWWQKVHEINNQESPAPQSAGLSEREKWEWCATALRIDYSGYPSAMDACLDYFEDDGDGAINLRDRILALADEKEATAARLAEHERGALPCSDCGGNAPEFVVSNEVWNALVRRNGPEQPGEYLCVWCFGERALATLADRERELGEAQAYPDEMDRCARIIWRTRDPEGVAEYERIGCGEPGAAWINGRLGGLVDSLRAERDALKEKLAAAERVVEAARARLEVWTRETYVGVRDALAAYDATRGQS